MRPHTIREQLTDITARLEHGRFVALRNGHYFVVWGLVVATGIAYNELHFLWKLAVPPPYVWMVLITAGWLFTVLKMRRERSAARTKSELGGVLKDAWISCGISMTAAFVAGGFLGVMKAQGVAALTAILLAGPLKLNARLAGERWLTWVAVLWWVCGLALFVTPPRITGLLLAFCLLALFVVPGLVLQAKARRLTLVTS
jgi:hypothetical protein